MGKNGNTNISIIKYEKIILHTKFLIFINLWRRARCKDLFWPIAGRQQPGRKCHSSRGYRLISGNISKMFWNKARKGPFSSGSAGPPGDGVLGRGGNPIDRPGGSRQVISVDLQGRGWTAEGRTIIFLSSLSCP
jgi:hypothetical protein